MGDKQVSRAWGIGSFCALLPIPFQMMVATPLCVFSKSNLPIAIALIWVTNPITMPLFIYLQYLFGNLILNISYIPDLSMSEIISTGIKPYLIGAIVSSVIFGVMGFFGAKIYLFVKSRPKAKSDKVNKS